MLLQTSEKARAIFFFDKTQLVGELLYPEFESMLDGFVPAKEWALRTVHAVYAEINHKLAITSAVFFKIGFDDHGWVDGSWNLPLGELARTALAGPDLGAGPIALATAGQSPVELLRPMLWDPEIKGRNSHFAQLKKAISRNRLGLCFVAEDKTRLSPSTTTPDLIEAMERRLSSVLTQHISAQRSVDIRGAIAQVLDEQAKVPVLRDVSEEHNDHIRLLEKTLAERDEKLKHLGAQMDALQERLTLSQDQLDHQLKKTEGLRDYYEHKLARLQEELDNQQPPADTQQQQLEIEQRVQAALQEFAELLQRKEVELLYHSEREEQLLAEIKRWQHQPVPTANAIIERLSAAGLNFVTYQFGSEPLVIQPDELDAFVENAQGFLAQRAGVSESHYAAWLAHYQMPICQTLEQGNLCGQPLPRILKPEDFVPQQSDCCPTHRA